MKKRVSKVNKAGVVREKPAEYSYTLKNQYAVVIEQDEDGFFVASVPALPGCHTQGKTLSELRANIKDVIKLCLDVAKKDGDYHALKAKSLVDKGIAEGLADVKAGRTYGPFDSVDEMFKVLESNKKKYKDKLKNEG